MARALVFDFEAPHEPGHALQLRVFEAYVMAECLLANLDWARYISRIDAIVHPLGLARHMPLTLMLDERLPWANAATIALLLGLGFARRVRWAYAAALALMLVQYAARYGIGEIPHGANLIGMCLLGFGLAPLAYRDPLQAERFTLGFVCLAVAGSYMSAAACKLIVSGPSWPVGEHLSLWIYNKAIDTSAKTGRFELSVVQEFLVERRWAGTLSLTVGVLTELGAGLIVFPRLRRAVLWAIVGLHVGIAAVLEIWFRSATLALALLALPVAPFRWLSQRLSHCGSSPLQHVSRAAPLPEPRRAER